MPGTQPEEGSKLRAARGGSASRGWTLGKQPPGAAPAGCGKSDSRNVTKAGEKIAFQVVGHTGLKEAPRQATVLGSSNNK